MSTQFKILLGILFTLGTLAVLLIVGVNEDNRMVRYAASFQGRNIERGAEYFDTYCKTCHGPRGQGVPSRGPALNRKDLLDTKNAPYLKAIRWGGTLSDFLHDTIAAGRPQPSAYYQRQGYQQPMPTWSSDYGGPLRPDQIDNLVVFIQNWAPGEFNPTVPLPTATAAGGIPQTVVPLSPTPGRTEAAQPVKPPFPLPPSNDVLAAGQKVYTDNCAICHGDKGDGNGAAAASLPKKPRNFTDCANMKQFTFAQHYDAVENGRSGGIMPPWKGVLTEDQIWQVIAHERSYCQVYDLP